MILNRLRHGQPCRSSGPSADCANALPLTIKENQGTGVRFLRYNFGQAQPSGGYAHRIRMSQRE